MCAIPERVRGVCEYALYKSTLPLPLHLPFVFLYITLYLYFSLQIVDNYAKDMTIYTISVCLSVSEAKNNGFTSQLEMGVAIKQQRTHE